MAFDFDDLKTVEESVKNNGIKILVHGMAGVGKTVLTATTGEKTIILNTENGLLSLKKWERLNKEAFKKIKILKIESFDDLKEAYKFLKRKEVKKIFSWVNLDSISEMAEQIIATEKAKNRDGRRAYGITADEIIDLLRKIRDLPYNVCMTAKQQYKDDYDAGKTMFIPMFPGQRIQQEISYMFDEVFALRCERENDETETKKDKSLSTVRFLQTENDGKYYCKDRSGILDFHETPNLKKIKEKIDKFNGEKREKGKNKKQKNKDKNKKRSKKK